MRVVVLSGGPTHDFPATTACLQDLLDDAGARAEVHTGVEPAFAALPGADLLVVNALFTTWASPGVPARLRGHEAVSPSGPARDALPRHLAGGGGLLGMHTAALCFEDWPDWGSALGGTWVWGRSQHPPLGPEITVEVTAEHPLVDGVAPFSLVDEVYGDLDLRRGVRGLLHAGQPAQPVLWAREHGGGRVVYDALGHHPPSYAAAGHREILLRAIRWAAGGS